MTWRLSKLSFNRAEGEPPFRLLRIAREIEANLVAPFQLDPVHQIELHVIGEHGADCVEIAAPKQMDILNARVIRRKKPAIRPSRLSLHAYFTIGCNGRRLAARLRGAGARGSR
jgi:hypothetical protein